MKAILTNTSKYLHNLVQHDAKIQIVPNIFASIASVFRAARARRSCEDNNVALEVWHILSTLSIELILLKVVKILGVERSAFDLTVIAVDSQEWFYIPWREFKQKYGAQAAIAVKEAGLDMTELEKKSQQLLDPRGTHNHGELEKLAETAGLPCSVEDSRSSFDWS
jgi:hypothetical protein